MKCGSSFLKTTKLNIKGEKKRKKTDKEFEE